MGVIVAVAVAAAVIIFVDGGGCGGVGDGDGKQCCLFSDFVRKFLLLLLLQQSWTA